ncbi:MAG: hypothetical protein KGP34_04750 [Bacteroidetes bacterium]|nr:hypothetical protein [Bacteroidota bacterium]
MRFSCFLLCFLAACQSPPKNRVDWDFQIPDRKGATRVYLDSTDFFGGGRGVDSVASPICVESDLPWEGKGKQVPGFSSEFLHRGTYRGPAVYQVVFYSRNSSPLWLVRLGSVSATQGTLRDYSQKSVSGEAWVRQAWNVSVEAGQHLRMEVSLLDPGRVCIRGLEVRKLL